LKNKWRNKLNKHIAWLLEVEIKEARNFEALMEQMITATRNEKGTVAYEWHLSKDNTACTLYERYESDEAVMAHLASFECFAERFLAACNPSSFVVFGDPSENVQVALKGFAPKYWKSPVGFNRFG
jgi:quinol monooxygenase YgiN